MDISQWILEFLMGFFFFFAEVKFSKYALAKSIPLHSESESS